MILRPSHAIVALLTFSCSVSAFFFGGGGGGGGGCACPPQPVCAPQPLSCQAPPPPASCVPQLGCGGANGYPTDNGYVGSSSYAVQSSSFARQPHVIQTSLSQYASGPSVPTYASGPVSRSSYASGPIAQPVPSGSYSGSPIQLQPIPQASQSEPVQVPAASYSTRSGGQVAAGQRLQKVDDELDKQMMSETKEEDSLRNSENSTSSLEVKILSSANGTELVHEPVDISTLNLINNAECNSEDLQKIIRENMNEDLNSSKRLIQLQAEAKFGGRFDVICSTNDFSYVTNTELYCQETRPTVSCYAYRQL